MKKHLALISITALGLILRLYNLTAISLWHDEAFSALLIKYSWSEMFYRISLDVHPPMYYVFLRLWDYIFGDSLWALRGFSVLFGVLAILIAYILVKKFFNSERGALLAALLIAVNPFQIEFVTEARMYTMGAFFALATAYCLVQALERQWQYYNDPWPQSLRYKYLSYYLLFAVCTAIGIYTHYYFGFTAIALGLYGLGYVMYRYRKNLKPYAPLIGSFVLVALSFLPWLKVFLFHLSQVNAGYWIPAMDRWSIPGTLWEFLLALHYHGLPNHNWLLGVTILSLVILLLFVRRIQSPVKWLVALNVIMPFLGAIGFFILAQAKGQETSIYLVRYFVFAAPFYTIMLAVWLDQIAFRPLRWFLVAVLISANLFAYVRHWQDLDVAHRPGMDVAVQYLQSSVAPKDKLFVGSSFEFFNLKYYLNQYFPHSPRPLLYTGGLRNVTDLPHFAGTALLTDNDLLSDFNTAVAQGNIVWLVWTKSFGSDKPQTPANWLKLSEQAFAEVRPYLGTNIYITEYKVR